jgi:hypothetical protein
VPALGLDGAVLFTGGSATPSKSAEAAQLRLLTASEPSLTPSGDVTTNAATSFEGGTWSVTSYTNEIGETCIGERLAGGGQGLGCYTAAELFAHGPVFFTSGGRQTSGMDDKSRWDVGWVWGLAAPDVSSVRIVSTDCTSRRAILGTGRIFLFLANRSALYGGAWPYKLIAEDTTGSTLYEALINFAPPMPSSPHQLSSLPIPKPEGCS